ncbi:hypothetical protein [Xylella fastidiosa]|uniref:hypothetical protein n=1 Tax=Xylella fastidiosa TaxID=2371 RepID=UPI001363BCB4|nr:hypothetical protein [Xylella fastidiosa]
MILDEFLIRLGAVADTSGFNTFSTGLTRVTGLVTVAAAAMGGALAGMNRFVGSALSELNALNSASQRHRSQPVLAPGAGLCGAFEWLLCGGLDPFY